GSKAADEAFSIEAYSTELRVPRDVQRVDLTVGAFEALVDGEVSVAAILREGARRYIPAEDWRLFAGDVLIVLGDPVVVGKAVAKTGFEIVGAGELAAAEELTDEMEVVEVIVTADSMLVGATPASLSLRHRYGVNLFAVRKASSTVIGRLRS